MRHHARLHCSWVRHHVHTMFTPCSHHAHCSWVRQFLLSFKALRLKLLELSEQHGAGKLSIWTLFIQLAFIPIVLKAAISCIRCCRMCWGFTGILIIHLFVTCRVEQGESTFLKGYSGLESHDILC